VSSAAEQTTDGRAIRGQATRDRIVDAAREVLIEQGHAGTSTRAVADRAGVRLSLVHYHFGGRQGLLVEVLRRENDELLERQRRLYAEPGPLAEKWRIACDLLDEDVGSGYVRLLWELWAAGLADTELAAGWRSAMAGWRDLLESVFAGWVAEHELELPLGPRALASLVANLFQGIEIELLAGVSEAEAPHREVLDALGAMIERAEAR
jgi:AcrR family transcriptional regulator